MIDDFEKQLKHALAKQDPSPFFEARVLAAVKRQQRERQASARVWWMSAVGALSLAVVLAAGSLLHHRRSLEEDAAGMEAKARLELALKVTSVKLQRISQKVEGIQQN